MIKEDQVERRYNKEIIQMVSCADPVTIPGCRSDDWSLERKLYDIYSLWRCSGASKRAGQNNDPYSLETERVL